DLACFNSYLIGQTIANHPLPILTGIGHQQDDTIADLVAHTALKTPTAVAEMVLNSFLWFEGAIKQLGLNVQQFANQLLQKSATELLQLKQLLQQNTALNLNQQAQILQNNKQKLTVYTKYFLNTQSQYLAKLMAITNAYNVEKLLSRGFSITRCNGKLITDNEQVTKGQIIETVLHSGKLRSKVE
ncbi:MAG TPA: exodeoxyribonuclease VII large subunit, partial [Chitinophagales bacterium]|nr:exodeoxyribonuclease VII large subunit [Chitinophagales bacterium]